MKKRRNNRERKTSSMLQISDVLTSQSFYWHIEKYSRLQNGCEFAKKGEDEEKNVDIVELSLIFTL